MLGTTGRFLASFVLGMLKFLESESYATHDNVTIAKDSRLVFVLAGNEDVAA